MSITSCCFDYWFNT